MSGVALRVHSPEVLERLLGLLWIESKVPGDAQLPRGRWWFRTTDLRLVRANHIRRSAG
jgi:hypothetical protein